MGGSAFSLAGSQAMQVLLGTALVIGLLLVFLWGLRRYVQGAPGTLAQRRIQVVEAHSLGPRQRLVLVRIDGEDMLLGLTGTEIRLLWPSRAAGSATAEARGPAPTPAAARAGSVARDWVSVR